MRKLYIINNQFSAATQYGIGTFIRELQEIMVKANYTVVVVNLCSSLSELKNEYRNGIQYLHIPKIGHVTLDNENYCKSVAYFLTTQITPKDKVAFQFNYMHHKPLARILKQLLPDARLILTVHYLDWIFELNGDVKMFKQIISKEYFRNHLEENIYRSYLNDKDFFQSVDKIVVLCNDTKRLLRDCYHISKNKIQMINNGIKDIYQEFNETNKKLLREKYNFSTQDKLVLFVGRIQQLKGIEILIEAIKPLLKKDKNIHLLLVGSGDEKELKKSIIGYWKQLHFVGVLNRKEVYELYQMVDVGVVPSLYEQFGYVAIEMMMFVLPLIVNAEHGGLKDIFKNEEFCKYVLSEYKPSVLTSQLECMLNNKPDGSDLRISFLKKYQSEKLNAYVDLFNI